MNNPNATLFAGELLDGRDADHGLVALPDSSTHITRVREMPARHHLELLDLFHVGREAELLQRCVEIWPVGRGQAIRHTVSLDL